MSVNDVPLAHPRRISHTVHELFLMTGTTIALLHEAGTDVGNVHLLVCIPSMQVAESMGPLQTFRVCSYFSWSSNSCFLCFDFNNHLYYTLCLSVLLVYSRSFADSPISLQESGSRAQCHSGWVYAPERSGLLLAAERRRGAGRGGPDWSPSQSFRQPIDAPNVGLCVRSGFRIDELHLSAVRTAARVVRAGNPSAILDDVFLGCW